MMSVVIRVWLFFLPLGLFLSSYASADLVADRHIDELVVLAKGGESSKFLDYLQREKLVGKVDKDGHTPLYAAMFGEPKLTRAVLQMGAPLEQQDRLGYTPLMAASLLGYPQAAKTLIDLGADLEARNNDGQTALLVSVLGTTANYVDLDTVEEENPWHNRWGQVTRLLLESGADVNAADERGATPLFLAIFSQDVDLCRSLIKAGADVNHRLPNGVSLLRFARTISSSQVVDLLLANGARE